MTNLRLRLRPTGSKPAQNIAVATCNHSCVSWVVLFLNFDLVPCEFMLHVIKCARCNLKRSLKSLDVAMVTGERLGLPDVLNFSQTVLVLYFHIRPHPFPSGSDVEHLFWVLSVGDLDKMLMMLSLEENQKL